MNNKVLVSIIPITWLIICMPPLTKNEDTDVNVDVVEDEDVDLIVHPDSDGNIDADEYVYSEKIVDKDEKENEAKYTEYVDNIDSDENVDGDKYTEYDENIDLDRTVDAGENVGANKYTDYDANVEEITSTFDGSTQSQPKTRFVRKLTPDDEDNLQVESNPSYAFLDSLDSSENFNIYEDEEIENIENIDEQDLTLPSLDTNYEKDDPNPSPPIRIGDMLSPPYYSEDNEKLPSPPNTEIVSLPPNYPPNKVYNELPNIENMLPLQHFSPNTEDLPSSLLYPPNNVYIEPPNTENNSPVNENLPSPSNDNSNEPPKNLRPNDESLPPMMPLHINIQPFDPNTRNVRRLEDGPAPEDEDEYHLPEESNPSYAIDNLQSAENYHMYKQRENLQNLQNNWSNSPVFATSWRRNEPQSNPPPNNGNTHSSRPEAGNDYETPDNEKNNPTPDNEDSRGSPNQPADDNDPPPTNPPSEDPPKTVPPAPNPPSNEDNNNHNMDPELPPIDHKPVRTPLSIFDKIKQMEGCEPPPCPVNYDPVCSITDGIMSVYLNECDLRQTKRLNPLRVYTEINKDCCMVFVKYGTVPQLNVK